ncbi:helix-turn-helix domain-containing protein [Rhizobium sp. BK176]|uniref:helix-turn-helix domain-containing protein n=1 Tax=Rhizobium sp. BK176 TaxID=2587071 RepID=UPI002166DF5A|nr:helix-turn-helix domain-containing protein [Rhizobium sp. BK176]MCS4089514.1 transcriptional regulator with XRE-family HTH domain [Rhizobium sp. BK176]
MTHDIKALRLSQSMSQKRLAHEAGIDVRTLRRIEGGVTVSPESYRAVCLALKIDPSVSIEEAAPEPSETITLRLASRLDFIVAKSLAFARTTRGKTIIAVAVVAVAVSAGAAVRAWWFRPNVSVTIAFDRSCDELGVWSKAFSAMDREFPDGYVVKDRIDGAKDCAYNFEGYYDSVGALDPRMTKLVRNLEHAGTKTTVTYISEPRDVTPRPKDYWEKDKLVTPARVNLFARQGYEQVYRLNPDGLDGDISYARHLFADQASFDGYVESLKSSGNLDAIAEHGLAVSVFTARPTLTEKGPDGIWTVKFRSKIGYSGKTSVEQCLDATVRVKEIDMELGILNLVSEPSVCRDRTR